MLRLRLFGNDESGNKNQNYLIGAEHIDEKYENMHE